MRILPLVLCIGAVTLSACAPHATVPSTPRQTPAPTTIPRAEADTAPLVSAHTAACPAAAAANALGFDIFAQLRKQEPGKNVFISPYSISTCLAMTLGGAGGKTRSAMAKTLHLDGQRPTDIGAACSSLRHTLETADPAVRLETANSIWVTKQLKLKNDFQVRCRDHFGATVQALDINDPAAPSMINAWVRDATHNKIDSIVDKLAPTDSLLLLNAVYFKGTWADEFDERSTNDAPFVPATGGPKNVPMMHNDGTYSYFETETFQAIRLPYDSERFDMFIFLPRRGVPLPRLASNLNARKWNQWFHQLDWAQGSIAFPRFKLAYEATLNDPLRALGMGVAFDPGLADFTGMASGGLYISSVIHKTSIDVDEHGTEAAATTGIAYPACVAPSTDFKFQMIVDHPFLYAISDRQTGAILFLGAMEDPTQG